ncbi:hypothetical protein GBA52_025410 [Prunus armeniaca]|nr:hypothetical protein GBA52_025410 [Prunus armeniaca]
MVGKETAHRASSTSRWCNASVQSRLLMPPVRKCSSSTSKRVKPKPRPHQPVTTMNRIEYWLFVC